MAIVNSQATSYGLEIPVFCLFIGALSLYMLDYVKGSFFKMKEYILSRNWYFIKYTKNYGSYIGYFSFIIICHVLMVLIAFIVWMAILFYNEDFYDGSIITPIAVITVGTCVISFSLGLFNLKWNQYKLTPITFIYFFLGFASFAAYQLCGNFLGDIEYSFFGISAIFLSCNGIVFIFLIFLNDGKHGKNFYDIVSTSFETRLSGDEEELLKQYQTRDKKVNPDYVLTKMEIDFFFTIKEEHTALISGGIIMDYGALSISTRTILGLLIYVVSIGILVGYSYIIYYNTPEYKLGFITMIAVITTDTIIYLFYYVRVSNSTLQLCITAIAFRACLFGFGGDYWFYGYCLLYAILGIIVSFNIAAKHFPIRTTVIPPETNTKDSNNILIDLMKTPEFLLIYSTVMFAIINACLVVTEPDGAPLPSLNSSEREYKFWCMSLLAFGIILLSYLIIAIVRIIRS